MTSLRRLLTLPRPPESIQISEHAWQSLRVTHRVTTILLGVCCLFAVTVFSGLFISRQVASTAALTELGLMLLAGVLTLACGTWSLHLRLREGFKAGNMVIAGALLIGSGTVGILVLTGIAFLVTR
jgi:hypothetical protein